MPGARQRALRRSRSRSPHPLVADAPDSHASGAASSSGAEVPRGGARQRAMKKQLPLHPKTEGEDTAYDPGVEFRNHIARLFLGNKFSGPETIDLVQRAYAAGAGGIDDLQQADVVFLRYCVLTHIKKLFAIGSYRRKKYAECTKRPYGEIAETLQAARCVFC